MQIYWGDLHNHCGITYGYGSQANALARAADHLDFCAITGHAMWPDIVERNEETAFIIDFHQEGFKKLRDHWDEVRGRLRLPMGRTSLHSRLMRCIPDSTEIIILYRLMISFL